MTLNQEQLKALSVEVDNLVKKSAIAPTSASGSFFSPIFVVLKKAGGWHPVVNLRALNQYILNPHFKMESIASLKDIIKEGNLMGRLDLKDTYLSVPTAGPCWRFLRFR